MEESLLMIQCRIELALGWYGNLDSLDVAALDLLSHGPHVCLPIKVLTFAH